MRNVLFPTDLGSDAEVLYAQALKIASIHRGTVVVVHVRPDGHATWMQLPTVREMLVRWGTLPPNATVEDYGRLGMRVEFHAVAGHDPVPMVLNEAIFGSFDLIVMGWHHRDVVGRWLRPPHSEAVVRRAQLPVLVVPDGPTRNLVSPATGAVSFRNVLIPIHGQPDAQAAVDAAIDVGRAFGVERASGTLFHVGDNEEVPTVMLDTRWAWGSNNATGDVAPAIRAAAEEIDADLVVMATRGHDSAADALFGSYTERVLHTLQRPLLVVPVTA
jgi:nucleotide-binding universal stress UspA family protein